MANGFYHDEHGFIHPILPATEDAPQPELPKPEQDGDAASKQ